MVSDNVKDKALRFAKKTEWYLKIGSDVGGAILELKRDSSPYQMAAIGARAAHGVLKNVKEVVPPSRIGWTPFFSTACFMDSFLSKWLIRKYDSSKESRHGPFTIDLDGYQLRYYPYEELLVHEEERDEVAEIIGRKLWEDFGPRLKIISTTETRDVQTSLSPWGDNDTMPSEKADELYERVKRRGAHKVLLYGPPGTGKSCMAKRVASMLGGMCLSIDVSSLQKMGTSAESVIENVVNLLQPTSIVIDDIDRTEYTGFMLSLFEKLDGRMVIASVNDITNLDSALLRPGRFDDLVEIKNVGSDVLNTYLENIPDHLHERAEALPVAFLAELIKRKGNFEEELSLLEKQYTIVREVGGEDKESSYERSGAQPVKAVTSKG